MTFNAMQFDRHMSSMSAQFAQANGSCAHAAAMQSANSITMTMDAGILASIIICVLVSLLALVRVSLLVVLLAVLVLAVLVSAYPYTPEKRWKASL